MSPEMTESLAFPNPPLLHHGSLSHYNPSLLSERLQRKFSKRERERRARKGKEEKAELNRSTVLADQHIAKVAKKNEQRIYLKEVSRAERESLKENSLEKGYDSAAKAIRTRCNS